jgi:hypothetical protein
MPNALPYEPKTLPYVVCRMSLNKRFCRDLATCGKVLPVGAKSAVCPAFLDSEYAANRHF